MDEKVIKRLEKLPFPAVALPSGNRRCYRNRLARCLLPPPGRLLPLLKTMEGESLCRICLEEISYLLVVLQQEDAEVYCFFENFLPLQEPISRSITENMQDFFWKVLNRDGADSQNTLHPDRIAARSHALRSYGDDYLRLLNVGDILKGEEPKSCCLEGFFAHLQRALSLCGIGASFHFSDGATVAIAGEELSFLVLNLIHLVRRFETGQQVCLEVKEEETGFRFCVDFRDEGAIAASLQEWIRYGRENGKLLYALPLFCILRVCLERGIPWSVQEMEGVFSFSFLLPKGDVVPVLFLSDPAAAEVVELMRMIKAFFS